MKKTPVAAAIALLLALSAGPTLAAPRITAQVDTRADATLSAAEQRAVSVAAGRLLRHTYDARAALKTKDKKQATGEIAKARNLVAIIEQAVPSYTVKSHIVAGDLSYEDEDTLKPTIIPIFDELDKVSLVAPLRQAKAEQDKAKGGRAGEVVAADALHEVRVTLDLGLAKGGLDLAGALLDKDDIEGSEKALAAVMDSLHFTLLSIDLPLDRARENLMLAKFAIEAGDTTEAKAALAEVRRELDVFAEGAGDADKKEVASLRDEMHALDGKLAAGKESKGLTATLEGWWDRIGKMMK